MIALTGNRIVKGSLGQMARLIGRVEDLIVEDRKVQRQTQADRVRRRQIRLRNLGRGLVGLERSIGRHLAPLADGELGQVAVVVTLPTDSSACARLLPDRRTYILW